MITKEELDKAVALTIAQSVVANLDEAHRQEFITRAIREALDQWSIRSDVQKLVVGRAVEVAQQLLAEGAWDAQIKAAVEEGLAKYVANLPEAITKTLVEAFHGRQGERNYDTGPGLILKHLKG